MPTLLRPALAVSIAVLGACLSGCRNRLAPPALPAGDAVRPGQIQFVAPRLGSALRQEPAALAQVVATLPYGGRILVHEVRGAWARVTSTQGVGWVRSHEITSRSPGLPGAASTDQDASTEWRITLDDNDRISVMHVENVLRRAGVEPTLVISGGGAFVPWGWIFRGPSAERAREVLMSDPSWPEVRGRLYAGPFSVRERLERAPASLRDVSLPVARAWLRARHAPATRVLDDLALVLLGTEAGAQRDRPAEELLAVAWLTVLERNYLGVDGRRHVGYEVGVEMRTGDDRWGRTWYGQVFEVSGGWHVDRVDGSGDGRGVK